MFEFQKLCREVEELDPAQRGALLAEKSMAVIAGLNGLDLRGLHPDEILASFVVGSVVSDGKIVESDYLCIYPSLEKAFGEACDLAEIKREYQVSKDVRKEIADFTQQLLGIIAQADEQLKSDIVLLCLLVTSVDGKVSSKEKRYIKQLCKS